MLFGSLLKGTTILVVLCSIGHALPQGTATQLTNAERMARGLGPVKPAKLYDPSKPNVLRPRSSAPPGSSLFSVAAGPSGSDGQRKRDNGVPGYFSVVGDALFFASAQADAAVFYYTNPSTETGLSAVTQGGRSDVYAVQSGAVYLVGVGVPPAGSQTNILTRTRYTGDLTPSVIPAGSTTAQEGFWVRGGSGKLFIATDYNSAIAYDPAATVLLVQRFAPGQQPSLAAAAAAQGSSLVNPVKFYLRDTTGAVNGYWWFTPGPTPMLVYQNSKSVGYTFYLPNFGTGASEQRALTTLQGNTVVGTIVPNSQGQYLKFNDASTSTDPILSFNVPASGSGPVSLTSGGTPLNLFYANGGSNSDTFRFLPCPGTDVSSCGSTLPNPKPVCIEAVMGEANPSVCLNQAKQQITVEYVGQSSIYVYDPAGQYKGYASYTDPQNLALLPNQDESTYVYSQRDSADQTPRSLYWITDKQTNPYVNRFLDSSNGYEGSRRILPSSQNSNMEAQFNIPTSPSSAEITLFQAASTLPEGVTNQNWSIYFSGSSLSACPSVDYCPADRGFTRVCTELVPAGGSPQLCVQGWQVPA